ncbi:hypothetical protein [Streptomyces sp. NPDC056361]|uniref:hypothetical protein n=1 Tax=Streptomyces sp. NPDC056361 TaxID=3345795 RepID=UPI0035E33C92
MELLMQLKRALDGLESSDLESRVRAVEDLSVCSSDIVEHVVKALELEQEAPHLIVERMGRFGSLAIAPLERLHQDTDDESLQFMTASALLYMGSIIGIPSLLAVVATGNPRLCMAATSLAAAQVSEAAKPIERALMECELSDSKTLECLSASLRELKHPLSENTRLRLSEVEPEWLRNSLLD